MNETPRRHRGFPNRWAERMDRDESSLSAAAMWAFFMVGSILLIASTIGALVSIVFISGATDGGTAHRIAGGLGLLASVGGFWLGRLLTDDYRVQPPSLRR